MEGKGWKETNIKRKAKKEDTVKRITTQVGKDNSMRLTEGKKRQARERTERKKK